MSDFAYYFSIERNSAIDFSENDSSVKPSNDSADNNRITLSWIVVDEQFRATFKSNDDAYIGNYTATAYAYFASGYLVNSEYLSPLLFDLEVEFNTCEFYKY